MGLAYRYYAMAYAPLALLNMLTVWRAALGPLVRHYRRALAWPGGGDFAHQAVAAIPGGPTRANADAPMLDVAIGDGALTALALRVGRLQPRLVGLDISPEMLAGAVGHLGENARFLAVRAYARLLPFSDGAFGRVCCFGSLHVIACPEEAMRQMARVLRSGGRFFASILLRPCGRWRLALARRYVELGLLSTLFKRREVLHALQGAGLVPAAAGRSHAEWSHAPGGSRPRSPSPGGVRRHRQGRKHTVTLNCGVR